MASTFTDDDAYRYKNKSAVDHIIPRTYAAVLDWACPKLPDETFEDVLKKKPDYNKCIKRYNHTVGLHRKDCTNLDAGFMQKYIPDACEKLDLWDKKIKNDNDPNYILYMLKRIRNDVCHQPKDSAISDKKLDEVDYWTSLALEKIGELHNIEKKIIDKKVAEIKELVQQVKHAVEKDDPARIRQYEILLSIDGMREVKTRIAERQYVLLPSSTLKVSLRDVFHDVVLVISGGSQEPKIVPYRDLGKALRNTRLFIEGIALSGKSILLRKLREDLLAKYKPVFPGKPDWYTIVLLMDCSNRRIKTVSDLIEDNCPNTLQKVDAKKAADSLKSAKLLILVDGLDELNESSETLLNTLINRFGRRKNTSFIFTSRSGTARPVKDALDAKGIPYRTGILQPIPPEEQNTFLDRYREIIPQPKTSDVIQGFDSLDEMCKNYLSWPAYLALLVHLHQFSTADNKNWNSESNLIDQTFLVLKRMTIDRMSRDGFKNPEIFSTETVEAIYDISLLMSHQNQESIDQKEMNEIFCKLAKPRKPTPQKFLSSFFISNQDENTYGPMHTTHRDFLAAKAICLRLETDSEASVIAIISEVLRVKTLNEERFRGAFRFVLMILLDNNKEKLFKRCLQEIRDSLIRTETDFSFWVELTSSCPYSVDVAEISADATKTHTWSVESARHMLSICRMIRHRQPPDLTVSPNATKAAIAALRPLLENINEHYLGKLTLRMKTSYSEFSPTDDFVLRFETARCHLVEFIGCLGSDEEAGKLLAACVGRTAELGLTTKLRVSLEKPRTHQLVELQGLLHELDVRVRAIGEDDEDRGIRPLPHGLDHRASLIVETALTSDEKVVTNLIKDLLPNDSRYRRLWIQNYLDDDEERETLLQAVFTAGVRTEDHGAHLRWTLAETDEDGTCEVCEQKAHRTAERCIELLLP